VDAACDAVGRSPSTLVKTGMARFAMRDGDTGDADAITGSMDEMAERLVAFRNLGLRHFVCGLDPRSRSSVEQFGEAIMRFDAHH
jgi:hypothetical protein